MLGTLILAGGEGKRIRRNKALLRLGEKPLLLHVVEKTYGVAQEIVVVIGNRDNPREYRTFLPPAITVLRDTTLGGGPLVGIVSGIKHMHSKYVLVLPCDSPFIRKEVINCLNAKAKNTNAVIPIWPNGNIEPLHSIYKISCAIPAAQTAIDNDELLVLDMIRRLGKVTYVSMEELKKLDRELVTFFNVNSLEDLRVAESLYRNQLEPS